VPVFDGNEAQRRLAAEKRFEEQKALEEEWAKKRRPKDVSEAFWCSTER
jgi:hypothetical protein